MTPAQLRPARAWKKTLLTALAIGVFLVPAFVGFGNKFLELIYLSGDAEGAFTVMPILNYLLASIGFFLMLCWAIAHGMFRDIERPKYAMLESERRLDEKAALASSECDDEAKRWTDEA